MGRGIWGEGFLPDGDCPGDFNGNGVVEVRDFMLFLTAYDRAWTGPYDLNQDAEVNNVDLLEVLSLFDSNCPE